MEQVHIDSLADLRAWLKTNHQREESIWLVRYKKRADRPYLTYDEIVDELLCFGWVDSLPRKLDADRTMLRISPRNPKSNWSGLNKRRVERLSAAGRMMPAGEALTEVAKANGAWNFLDDVEQLIVPPDLAAARAATDRAAFCYDRFPDSSKRGILEWIKNARTEATRSKRIRETAEKAARNVKANFPEGRNAGPAPGD